MAIHFIEPVPGIIDEIKKITGKPIRFVEKENLPTYASIRIARSSMSEHLLFYKKEHDQLINHLIVHECAHLIRMFGCPENQRIIPCTNQETKTAAMKAIEDEIIALTRVLSEPQIVNAMNLWYEGIIRQLTNLPTDIMIERWIYDKYPMLRELQFESLRKQHSDAIGGLSGSVRKITPPTILNASNIMNYAFFRNVGIHINHNFIKQYSTTEYLQKGKKLAAIAEDNCSDNHQSDTMMIGKWAAFLNLTDWFTWCGFEDVPTDYAEY